MRWHWQSWPSLNVSSPALIVSLPGNRFLNKLAYEAPNNIARNCPFCSFAWFLIVSLMGFINNQGYSSDLIIFMISFISLLEINNVVLPDSKIFLWTTAFVADSAAVNSNGIKTLLANGLSTFPIKGNPVFSIGPESLPKNSLDCPILWNWVFGNSMLAKEIFAKILRSFELVNNNLCCKLFSSLESATTFD